MLEFLKEVFSVELSTILAIVSVSLLLLGLVSTIYLMILLSKL